MVLVKNTVQINDSELSMYMSLLINNKLLKTNNYEEVISKLKDCFKVDVTEEQLNRYFSPSLGELISDQECFYKNLGLC